MGWYSGGTRVVRYALDAEHNTIDFEEVAAYIPAGGSTWIAKALARNPHDPGELVIATADARGFDLLAVRLPQGEAAANPGAVPILLLLGLGAWRGARGRNSR